LPNILLKDWINNGAKSYTNEIPCSSAEDIFVCNQAGDEITVIDAENMIVKRTIDVNFNPVGVDHPDHVVRKDGYIYVSLVSAGKVLKIDFKTYQIVGTVDGLQSPGMLVFNSDSKKLFVSKSPLAAGSLTGVYEINPETMTLTSEIILPTAGVPHGIAITPDDKLLIADLMNDRIYIYNSKLNDYDSDPIEMSPGQLNIHAPMHAYTSPDGKYLYVSCRNSNNVIIYDLNTRLETARINVGHHPMQMAITPDGNLIYVTIFHENKIKVLRKEGTNWNIENEISHPAFSMPWGIDLTKDGKYIVVTSSNESNTYKPRYKPKGKERISNVVFIETATNEVVKVLDVESYASGINAR
jgi:YVTN family beta-propeller protein